VRCPFCEIVAGERDQPVVHEGDRCMAFLCEPPAAWGHVLVVPRAHAADLWAVESETFAELAETARRLAFALRSGLAAEGVNLRANSGGAAGQDVFHLHLHVIPRYAGDSLGRACVWGAPPWRPPEGGDAKRAEVAAALRDALALPAPNGLSGRTAEPRRRTGARTRAPRARRS
jgi:histidine triad (HIT) family protein